MRNQKALLGGAALGVLLAVSLGATADAKPKHHKHVEHMAGRDLGAEVEALRARLDAEEAARQQDQTQIAAAQSDAAAARADADAARAQVATQIQTIPGVVAHDVAAIKPKPDNTVISSRVYADLSNVSQSPTPNSHNGTGFDIKRAYLGVDHKFNDIYSANLTVDFAANTNGNGNNANGVAGTTAAAYIKKAYVQAKVFGDELVVRGGAADMPWIPFAEDVYGYRFVEKTIVDTNSFGNSADWGAHALGKIPLGDGISAGYAVSVVDGGGYKNPDHSKGMDVEARANLNVKDFVVAIGGYTGKLDKDVQAAAPTTFHTANRFDALAAYTGKQFRVGVEYFSSEDWKRVTALTADKSAGYSAFASFNFTPMISVFGRYDAVDPSKTLAPSEKLKYFNIGVNYEPVKVVDLALVYKHDDIAHAPVGGYADANTTLAPLGGSGHFDEVGLFGQFRF
jgi:hypothetical protein